MSKTRYIFVTGGVSSSLGAGLFTASLGKLLQASGYSVVLQKLDPYINVNSGMLNPYEHGECYVTNDGHEGDLDLGLFERFLNVRTSRNSDVTAGRIFQNVIRKEREGAYLGRTVQVVPNITNEIKQHIYRMSKADSVDFVIVEIGGTVGDIESLPFIEAERQVRYELGRERWMSIHLTLVPYLAAAKEIKTKPTQHSVKQLLELGVQPDILALRTEHQLNPRAMQKVGLFCNVRPEAVFELMDLGPIYGVPQRLLQQGLQKVVLQKFGLEPKADAASGFEGWHRICHNIESCEKKVRIGLVGKYVELPDAYRSIRESLVLASANLGRGLDLSLIQSDKLSVANAEDLLGGLDALLVAPGFGQRGIEGKMVAARYARERDLPFFGIGLGMQCAVIEFIRNEIGIAEIDSAEMNPAVPFKVFDILADEKSAWGLDGSMRLGAYNTELKAGSLAAKIYGQTSISERHRHRFEFNNDFADKLEAAGMCISGMNADYGFADIIELPKNRWYIGVQFQPEFNSTVDCVHPLFVSFVKAAMAGSEV